MDPATATDDTIVCCTSENGQPVALILSPEERRRLARELLTPAGGVPRLLPGGRRIVHRRRLTTHR
ncbi:hypothetical protein TR51_06490 [Kitasatospora griseola]|uniref:Uncharacterized protein n=2 Tax=Kitasatospora griseola TaxID=2064 RepID=A0A0D0Q396_KITGR|nr:hypothetical protein TR51_06490 [Kitasatospora griseola]